MTVSIANLSPLIVEDDTFSRTLLRDILRDLGCFQVIDARDGAEAMDLLVTNAEMINCVISDFDMPYANGLQLLRFIRLGERGVRSDLPFAMLTSHSDKHIVNTALALDINGFIRKPVSKSQLKDRLTHLVGTRRRVRNRSTYRNVTIPDLDAPTNTDRNAPHPEASEGWHDATSREVPRTIETLQPGAVLAREVRISGKTFLTVGHQLTDDDIAQLTSLTDIEEFIGPIGTIWVRRDRMPEARPDKIGAALEAGEPLLPSVNSLYRTRNGS